MFNVFHIRNTIILLGIINLSQTGSVVFVDRPLSPVRSNYEDNSRSWTPTRGSVVFPPSKTNAGQLQYQLEDAAKSPSSVSRPVPIRPPRTLYFPDGTKIQTHSSLSPADHGFRPSPEIPVTIPLSVSESVKDKRENLVPSTPPFESSSIEESYEAPSKSPRLIKTDILPPIQIVDVVTPSPSVVDYSDLVDAMEQLVERIDELELKIEEGKKNQAIEENSRSISDLKSLFLATKDKLEVDITSLMGKTHHLEQRLSTLEEITREWIDPNILEQDYSGKSNGKRGATRGCPVPFFSLDETNPASPCYYISNVPNFRKNWQDASANCHEARAKLAEPKSSEELVRLTDYLRYNRTDQLGGGYWTGGLNPGLMWLWPSVGSSLTNIDPDLWLSVPDPNTATETNSGKCLRLSYDRTLNRYALQGSDCQRYLYFVCEYDVNATASPSRSLESKQLISNQQPSTTTFAPLPPAPSVLPTTTTTTTTTTQTPLLPSPPTPNYVGVIGFKGISYNKQINNNPLNLAVLDNSQK